jgi:LysM repeat protein
MKGKSGKIFILALLAMQLVLATGIVAHASPAWAGRSSSSGFYYTVQPGDTLYSIARRHGTTVDAIAQANGILNPAYIRVGQALLIPTGPAGPLPSPTGGYYTVQRGDNLYRIALRFGTTYWVIAVANNLANPNYIYAGQRLLIPGYAAPPPIVPPVRPRVRPTATPTPTPTPQVAVCSPQVNITEPTVNAELDGSGITFVRGTAAIDNFWYYKLEFAYGEWPTEWSLIEDLHFEPVVSGYLGDWKTGALPEGVYQLRLVVVDGTGNYPEPCQVQVNIVR